MSILKRLIKEELGVQKDVQDITTKLVPDILNNLTGGLPIRLYYGVKTDHISELLITIEETERPSHGKFLTNRTERLNNGFMVTLNLLLNENDLNNGNLIGSILSHELNHAYSYIKKLNKPVKTLNQNYVVNMLRIEFNQFPQLKEFMDMLYLNLPEEVQARVQETGYLLSNLKGLTYQETIKQLYLHSPFNDVIRMTRYTGSNLKTLDKDILNDFITKFNRTNKIKGIPFKEFKNFDQFVNYYVKFINKSGDKLNKKILKLVAKNFNEYYLNIGNDMLFELFNVT